MGTLAHMHRSLTGCENMLVLMAPSGCSDVYFGGRLEPMPCTGSLRVLHGETQ